MPRNEHTQRPFAPCCPLSRHSTARRRCTWLQWRLITKRAVASIKQVTMTPAGVGGHFRNGSLYDITGSVVRVVYIVMLDTILGRLSRIRSVWVWLHWIDVYAYCFGYWKQPTKCQCMRDHIRTFRRLILNFEFKFPRRPRENRMSLVMVCNYR